ncbi:MAG: hypothetical protein FD171_872 [Actinobacteria bacterium]|nr:MAG: hypothetical protein FD171_872 [Actinomycetota bacterium]
MRPGRSREGQPVAFASSSAYIYLYVVFAVVYMASSIAFVFNALRVSTSLSRVHNATPAADHARHEPGPGIREFISHSQRLVDYTQLATLLPLVYVVGSMFLGSLILGGQGHSTVNIGWVALTIVATVASVAFVVLGMRESSALGTLDDLEGTSGRANDALQRIGMRLGVSAALLLLMTVFMVLNLYSVLAGMQDLLGAQFLI